MFGNMHQYKQLPAFSRSYSLISDPIEKSEIQQAYLLYASLHGLDTTAEVVEERLDAYLANQPDSVIDLAIVAYQEDQIVAPPDVVVAAWGMSRVYNLCPDGRGHVRHAVNMDWFDSGCEVDAVDLIDSPSHFWTTCRVDCNVEPDHLRQVSPGARLRFACGAAEVSVHHRMAGELGKLSEQVATDVIAQAARNVRYLSLIDSIEEEPAMPPTCKLLVVMANSDTPTQGIADYAANAFYAQRAKC